MSRNEPEYIAVIDWETTGADWDGDSHKTYQGIQLGCVIANIETYEAVDDFSANIVFDESRWKWSDEAAKVHGLTIEHLQQTGLPAIDVAVEFGLFLRRYFGDKKIMFAGHNCVAFDIPFTQQLFDNIPGCKFGFSNREKKEIFIPVHHVVLDTSIIGQALFGIFKSDKLFDYFDLPPRQAHNALEDAYYTLITLSAMRDLARR